MNDWGMFIVIALLGVILCDLFATALARGWHGDLFSAVDESHDYEEEQ